MLKTLGLTFIFIVLVGLVYFQNAQTNKSNVLPSQIEKEYWFILNRKSNKEFLYFGEAGNTENSALVKSFKVKSGIPWQRPTPLPELVGRQYWLVTAKYEVFDNPETAPYFLKLDVPVSDSEPYGPVPYDECNGQCNWELPGAFGLHGNNGDPEKLAESSPGSSGCIRHTSEDITYLYNLLDLNNSQVRYYIYDI